MRTLQFFYSMFILLLVTVLFSPSGSAQDYTRWQLPEGAIVRFGQGGSRDFVFLPDGTVMLWDMNRIFPKNSLNMFQL